MEQLTFLEIFWPSCHCGCGGDVKAGRKYASRRCANRVHGQARVGTHRGRAWQETSGHGRAVEIDRYRSKI